MTATDQSLLREAEGLLQGITEGEWIVRDRHDELTVVVDDDKPGYVAIAEVSDQNEDRANAQFIAAAPRLLRACVEREKRLKALIGNAEAVKARNERRLSSTVEQRAWADGYCRAMDELLAVLEARRFIHVYSGGQVDDP